MFNQGVWKIRQEFVIGLLKVRRKSSNQTLFCKKGKAQFKSGVV